MPCDCCKACFFFPPIFEASLYQVDFSNPVCLAGDLNCALDLLLDWNDVKPHPESVRYFGENWLAWWVEIAASQFCKQFTWGRCYNDRVYFAHLAQLHVNNSFQNFILSPTILPSSFSKHHLVTLKLS